MECPSCGSENPEGSLFCLSCGAPLETPATDPDASVPPGQPVAANGPYPTPRIPSRRRPGCVTAYVILMLIAFIVVIPLALLATAQGLSMPTMDPLAIVVIIATVFVLAGLWRMKNWARIGMILLESFSILRTAFHAVTGGYEGFSGADLAIPVFSVVLQLYVIYWFATHRQLFD